MGRILSLLVSLFFPIFKKFVINLTETGTNRQGTRFSPIDNELLEHLKEKTDQTNSKSYPFIDAFIPMSMVRRISSALSFLVLRCVLKSFLSFSLLSYHVFDLFRDPKRVLPRDKASKSSKITLRCSCRNKLILGENLSRSEK
jgi:hypothetical protein